MSRILITGNAGSGKTTLARKVAASLNAPFHSMDKIVWQEKWVKSSPLEISRGTQELISQHNWVIDGVSNEVMAAADSVVFLDVPRRLSYLRVLKRNHKYLFHSRPDLPPHCPEVLIVPRLVKMIWHFPRRVRPRILRAKKERPNSFVHIRSNKELETYLQDLTP